MDVSFEPTMAGGEWGGDVGNISMTQAPQVAAHIEKIPLPVALKELEGLVTDDDKFHIGNYGFTNVRLNYSTFIVLCLAQNLWSSGDNRGCSHRRENGHLERSH